MTTIVPHYWEKVCFDRYRHLTWQIQNEMFNLVHYSYISSLAPWILWLLRGAHPLNTRANWSREVWPQKTQNDWSLQNLWSAEDISSATVACSEGQACIANWLIRRYRTGHPSWGRFCRCCVLEIVQLARVEWNYPHSVCQSPDKLLPCCNSSKLLPECNEKEEAVPIESCNLCLYFWNPEHIQSGTKSARWQTQ
jgi:hypothetical protein